METRKRKYNANSWTNGTCKAAQYLADKLNDGENYKVGIVISSLINSYNTKMKDLDCVPLRSWEYFGKILVEKMYDRIDNMTIKSENRLIYKSYMKNIISTIYKIRLKEKKNELK